MQYTSSFRQFMTDLTKSLAIPAADAASGSTVSVFRKSPAATPDFKVTITEGKPSGEITFSVRLGIASGDIDAEVLRKLLALNCPLSGSPPIAVGLHPRDGDIVLWCRASLQAGGQVPLCIEILERLVHQARDLKHSILADTGNRPHPIHNQEHP
jgi:hypothetical protein